MEIITGYMGKPHVTAEQDRDVNQGIVGAGSYVLRTGMQMEAEVSSNNEIKIRDGVLMLQGCTASIKKNTYDSLTIMNGSQGMQRIDLIVARYQKNRDTGVESLELKVIQGTPAESSPAVPGYTEGDIQAGDYIADMPMYQVIINGLNITEVKQVFEVEPDIDTLKKELAELNGNMNGIKYKRYAVTKNFAKGTNDAITIDIPWSKIVSIQGTLRYGANLHALPTSPVGGSGTYNEGMLAQLVITSSNVIQLWVTTAWTSTTLTVVVGYTD